MGSGRNRRRRAAEKEPLNPASVSGRSYDDTVSSEFLRFAWEDVLWVAVSKLKRNRQSSFLEHRKRMFRLSFYPLLLRSIDLGNGTSDRRDQSADKRR